MTLWSCHECWLFSHRITTKTSFQKEEFVQMFDPLKTRSRRAVPRCRITINTCQVSRAIFSQDNKTLSFSPTPSHPSVLRSSLLFDTIMFHPQECASQTAAKSAANASIFLLPFSVQVELSQRIIYLFFMLSWATYIKCISLHSK